ncbi:KAP family P-loop NTPase fold protein [Anaerotignum sp.]|uniref:KAP family P-loop NTPase fold protein n=1 Tax=Anaerotignum sp. TaxID=2039241 RepID=UPI00289A4A6C|nr:P-loop NTPase fold protein [Anaerotignum sp.]
MKSYELQPTYENLLNTYLNDTIARDKDVFYFIEILNSINDSCAISLDGGWGSGKTFFVKQIKMVLDAHNDFITSYDDEDKRKIKALWAQHHKNQPLELETQVSVYYDSWENDNDEDPILSLVYSILQSVENDYSFKKGADCLQIAANIMEFFSGKNWMQLINNLKGEDPLQKLKKEKEIQQIFKEFMDSLLLEKGNRLVVFIDELDRCKPSYAVRLLERIKHYFSNNRITFVFSVNTYELQHTIKQYYGVEFNASKYLDRFFDLRISLPPADLNRYYQSINFDDRHYTYDIVCDAVIRAYHFELREIAKYLKLTKVAAYEPTHGNKKFDFLFSDGRGLQFGLIYVVPIMIGLKICDSRRYSDFINGRDYTPLLEIANILRDWDFYRLLSRTESFEENDDGKTVVSLESKLKELYNILFVNCFTNGTYEVCMGEYSFDRNTRETLIRTASLLSRFANTDID